MGKEPEGGDEIVINISMTIKISLLYLKKRLSLVRSLTSSLI